MNAKLSTLVLAGLAMIGPFAIDTYLPSFPAIAEHFDVAPMHVQQTLSVYLIAFAMMNLFYGTSSAISVAGIGHRLRIQRLCALHFVGGQLGDELEWKC